MDRVMKAFLCVIVVVLPSVTVALEARPGGEVSLECPDQVSRSEATLETTVEENTDNFIYRYRISSASNTSPYFFSHFRIEWSQNAVIKSWPENIFKDCRLSNAGGQRQALVCWARIPPVSANETGEIVMESPNGPRLSRYVIETAIPVSESVLSSSFKQALLPYFHNSEQLLTESVYDAIMENCDSARKVSRFSNAIAGATLAPYRADARNDAPPPVIHRVRRSEFAGFRAYAEAEEARNAGSEGLVAVGAFGDVLSEEEASAAGVSARCNMDSIFVFPESALSEERGDSEGQVRVIDHHPDKALYAITLTPRKPCPVVEQQFTLKIPAAR